ncbi:hypothetical protein J6590_048939 [Homalodisca vitripennis]|nr:hypothetical protein J6590_048939 [Homalodisca vitripennis]
MPFSNEEAFQMLMVLGECFQNYSAAALLYAQRYPDREHHSRNVFKDLLVEFVIQVMLNLTTTGNIKISTPDDTRHFPYTSPFSRANNKSHPLQAKAVRSTAEDFNKERIRIIVSSHRSVPSNLKRLQSASQSLSLVEYQVRKPDVKGPDYSIQ